jgi:hypothetical protein
LRRTTSAPREEEQEKAVTDWPGCEARSADGEGGCEIIAILSDTCASPSEMAEIALAPCKSRKKIDAKRNLHLPKTSEARPSRVQGALAKRL